LKKWLVLSCNTGEGHNSAARAVMEAALEKSIACTLKDPISFGGTGIKNTVSSAYNSMIQRAPTTFGIVYKAGELFEKTGITSPVYYANALYAKSLFNYLHREAFDAVICTHLYGMEAMTAVRRREKDITPCFGILTDYTSIPFLAETDMDAYFIPHKDLVKELAQKGIPEGKIVPTGIPVSSGFSSPVGRKSARNYLVIPTDRLVYIVMSGGMGCGDLQKICDCFLEKACGDYVVYIFAGRNDDIYEKLRLRYQHNPKIQVIAFTDKIHYFMEAADAMITKPGGLSSTEAIVLGVPLVHVLFIPGCEPKNAAFFSERGLSVFSDSPADAVDHAIHLSQDHEATNRMRANQREHAMPNAARHITEWVASHAN